MEVQETLGGRYKLLHELGSGGMAVVWRARDEVLGRPVAVKVLAGRFAGDPQSRARIRDEARAAATLCHPNIAQVYDYGESAEGDPPLPYVVMELVNGPTLQQRVASAPLPPRTIFRICGEVAAALAAAHADGLVHRDIKMANIMVTPTGAKVVDFGIAAAVGPAEPEEMLVGTPAYLAPERLTGDAVQPASDVYALGVLLYRLLAHEPPWSVETTTQMLNAHIHLDPSPLPALPGVPPDVADLIDRCLRKDPADRPSAAEVSATLGDAAEASLLPVRGPDTRPVLPNPRGNEVEFDQPTSVPARHGAHAAVEAPPTGPRGRVVPGRDARSPRPSASVSALAAASETGREATGIAPDSAPWPRPAGGRPAAPASPIDGGAAALFVPGAEIGAVREPLPGADQDVGDAFGGPGEWVRPQAARPWGRPSGRPSGETKTVRPPGGRSWIPEGRLGEGSGDGSDRVRPRRRTYLLAGGGVVALLAAALFWWGLPDRAGKAGPTTSGVTGAVSRAPSEVESSAPGTTGDGSATRPDGAVVGVRPAPGVTAPARSSAPSGAAAAAPTPTPTPTEGAPRPSDSAVSLAPATPDDTRLSSAGGVVYAVCDRGKARLTRWEPAPGYRVQKVDQGPAIAPEVVFVGAPGRDRMTVTCVADTPTPLVLPL